MTLRGPMGLGARAIWACALVFFLAAALPADAAKILRRGNFAEPYSLDPHRTTGINEANIIGEMLTGLYADAADGKRGCLAEVVEFVRTA